jgi:hypothetical protein
MTHTSTLSATTALVVATTLLATGTVPLCPTFSPTKEGAARGVALYRRKRRFARSPNRGEKHLCAAR